MRCFFRRNRLIISWLVSYVVILLVPLVMGLFVYRQSLETIREETIKTQVLSLGQISGIIDGKLEELATLNNSLSTSMNIQRLVSAKGKVGPDEILAITYVQKYLTSSRLANSFVSDIYIYIENNNILFSDANKFSDEEIDVLLFENFGLSKHDFEEMLRAPLTRRFYFTPARNEKNTNDKQILYVQTLYNMTYTKPCGLIVMLIDTAQIMRMMKNIEQSPTSNILLLNDKNQFIATGDMSALMEFCSFSVIDGLPSMLFHQIGGEEYVISHSKSNLLPLLYVSFVPTEVFLHAVRNTARIFYIYAAVCVGVGTVLSSFFTRRNHIPVKKLMSLFIRGRDKGAPVGENEFTFLEQSMTKLLEEHKAYENRLRRQDRAMRDQLFIKLLKGRAHDYRQIAEAFAAYGVRFTEKAYTVALILPDQTADSENEALVNMIYYAIHNIMEDLARKKPFAFTAEADGMIACMLSVGPDDLDLIKMAVKLVEDNFQVTLSASVSSACYGLSGIPLGYAEALEGLEYRRLLEQPEHVVDCGTLPHEFQLRQHSYRDMDRERMFLHCMRAGDFGDAEQILDSLMEDQFKTNPGSLQMVKFRMSGVINMMLSAIGEISTEESLDFFDSLDVFNQLLNAQSLADLRKKIKDIFNSISDYYKDHHTEEVPQWVRDMEKYIAGQYMRQDLSIAAIAEHFKLNASYLSRSFKRIRGVGLLDYIHTNRINRAKELLIDTDMSLDEVAHASGYTDGKALIRTFKKLEGVTPGRYRMEQLSPAHYAGENRQNEEE